MIKNITVLVRWLPAVLLILGMLALWQNSAPAGQIVNGQIDTFQDGTLASWANANAPDPVNVTTGGPTGSGDRYLQVSSGTFGGGSRLISFNANQWDGNFISAGVSAIAMDLENFGTQALSMRIALRQSGGNSATPSYASTTAFVLPADGAWHHAVFAINAANLTALNSATALATFLTSVGDFRVLSSASPAEVGDKLNGRFGMDNLTAAPEPATLALLVSGFGLVLLSGGIRRRQAA